MLLNLTKNQIAITQKLLFKEIQEMTLTLEKEKDLEDIMAWDIAVLKATMKCLNDGVMKRVIEETKESFLNES